MRGMRRANAGMTLVELLTVVVIVGILASIAIPSYRGYVLRANRADGKSALLALAGALERCFTRDNVYNGPTCNATIASLPLTVPSGKYQITNGGIAATTYSLNAVPQGAQTADTKCGTFTLDDKNTRGASGTSGSQECWNH